MSTIVNILSTDVIANSRADLNTNFSNLNTDKVEGPSSSIDSEVAIFSGTGGKTIKRASSTGLALLTSGVLSVITTSAALAAAISDETGSGALVFGTSPTIVTPTIASFTNATHTHQNAGGGGTLDAAAIAAGTLGTARLGSGSATSSTYLRGDQTWAALPSAASTVAIVPYPADGGTGTSTFNNSTNTSGAVTALVLPLAVTVNKISFNVTAVGTSGTLKIGVFSQDGQTQYISVTTGTISGTGITTVAVSAVALAAGVYYVVVIPVSTAAITLTTWNVGTLVGVTSEPTLTGLYTVTASTMPATLTIANISPSGNNGALIRLDN